MKLYRLLPDTEGMYTDAAGNRYTLQVVRGSNRAQLFTPFASWEACLAAWGMQRL